MRHSLLRRFCTAAVLVLAGLVAVPASASADESVVYPAGLACAGFDLQVSSVGGHIVTQEFKDASGHVLRRIQSGRGPAVTVTNTTTGATVAFRGNGFQQTTVVHPDGSLTSITMGHSILILFPTDVPAGPSTRLIVGRTVVDITNGSDFSVRSISGTSTDLCAALS
jgi:hypothetical protein